MLTANTITLYVIQYLCTRVHVPYGAQYMDQHFAWNADITQQPHRPMQILSTRRTITSQVMAQAPVKPSTLPQITDLETLLTSLTSESHLHRAVAQTHLQRNFPRYTSVETDFIKSEISRLLCSEQIWQSTCGATIAAKTLLTRADTTDRPFLSTLLRVSHMNIAHPEARVREATCELIGSLGEYDGVNTWDELHVPLLASLVLRMKSSESERRQIASRVAAREADEKAACAKLSALNMVHETEGWRGLETVLTALGHLFNACGHALLERAGGKLLNVNGMQDVVMVVNDATYHDNRFVREAGLDVVCGVASAGQLEGVPVENDVSLTISNVWGDVLQRGLMDNWSQVRYRACEGVRMMFYGLKKEERKSVYDKFLPRICLNRHYVAEGVRVYSQHTWETVISSDGRAHILKDVGLYMDFYSSQCKAKNHAVREAACESMKELVLKLDASVMKPFAKWAAGELAEMFDDEAWPVRDHACVAMGAVLGKFRDLMGVKRMNSFFGLFQKQLRDNVSSVRQNCAQAILTAYEGGDSTDEDFAFSRGRIFDLVREALRAIEGQKSGAEREGKWSSKATDTQFGAASRVAGELDEACTDQILYSCGSLAPKMGRKSKTTVAGGCSGAAFVRESEGWEIADGGVLLWRELLERGVENGMELMTNVVEAGVTAADMHFRGRLTFLLGVLEAIARGVSLCKKKTGGCEMLEGEGGKDVVGGIVRIVASVEKDDAMNVAKTCRRVVMSVLGVTAYGEVSRRVGKEMPQGSGIDKK